MSTQAAPVALRGSLEDFSASEILSFLAGTHQTGVLQISGDGSGSIWFANGQLYFGESETNLPLHEALVRSGIVSEAGWEAASSSTTPALHLGEALVVVGAADANGLRRVLRDRVVDAVFELLVMGHSQFEFHPGEIHELIGCDHYTVDDMVEESLRRLERWKVVATIIPSTSVVVGLARTLPPGSPDLVISPEEWRVLAALDGRRTIAEVTRNVGASAFEVCGVLHRLVTAGAAVVVS